jgi:hypothetical protein
MIRKLIVSLFALLVAGQIQAVELAEGKIEKNYISSDRVRIEKDTIFVFLHNQWVQTPSLHSDSRGVYVDEIKLLPWYCSNCNRWTTGWFCCEHCGALPDKG